MKIAFPIPTHEHYNVVRDVLYGCWCKGRRIGGGSVPPLTLLAAATVLKESGHQVTLMEGTAAECASALRDSELIVLLTSTMTMEEDAQFLATLKRAQPDLKTIAFGAHPTFCPKESLARASVDYIILFEPELPLRELVQTLSCGGDLSAIRGIGWKENGAPRVNHNPHFFPDLDELPIPDRSLLPAGGRYFNPLIDRYPYTTSETSRGCPKRCSFCTAPKMYGGKVRAWSVGKVLEEIAYLLDRGYRTIYYRDETFTALKVRNRGVFDELKRRGFIVHWLCNVAVGTAGHDDLREMQEAGCYYIKVGVESGAQEILDRSCKGILLSQTRDLFRWAHELRINTHAHLMLGMPGETRETMEQTLRFAMELRPTTIDIGICTPYPGTDLYEQVAAEFPEIGDASDITLRNLHTISLYNRHYTSLKPGEIEAFLTKSYRRFYLNPGYIFRQLRRCRSLTMLISIIAAGLNVIRFSLFGEGSTRGGYDVI